MAALRSTDVDALARGVRAGERRALARAITLVESTHPGRAQEGHALLERLMPHTGGAARVGITGTPGVGKSTFIEALGLFLVGQGKRVAVLAVDPSSPRSGGSLLGDKTRMETLGRDPHAFIRPSPSRGALGGIAAHTREALLLVEASGFDVVLVETVGVGQSEVEVASMVDTFVLLLQPGAGDALQGVKRGVLELADVLVVNKADGELEQAARRTGEQYRQSLGLFRPSPSGWVPKVVLCSALSKRAIDGVWEEVEAHRAHLEGTGALAERRADQAERWMRAVLTHEIERRLAASPRYGALLAEATAKVRAGTMSATRAALELVEALLGEREVSPPHDDP